MDKTTTKICTDGVGRLGYAKVLVEVKANKEIKDKIKICCKDKNNVTIRFKFVNVVYAFKFVNVVYAWKPLLCDDCKVFGHEVGNYKNYIGSDNVTNSEQRTENRGIGVDKDGYTNVQNNKKWNTVK
ncbi:hypothetical protein Tco_1089583 [Tanacetum coccineum]